MRAGISAQGRMFDGAALRLCAAGRGRKQVQVWGGKTDGPAVAKVDKHSVLQDLAGRQSGCYREPSFSHFVHLCGHSGATPGRMLDGVSATNVYTAETYREENDES